MIAVVYRVDRAAVEADGQTTGWIGNGLLVLLGVLRGDDHGDMNYIVRKTAGLRIFSENGKMDKSVADVGGSILLVSQFTLAGDARKGRRPDFGTAADPETAQALYDQCAAAFAKMGIDTQTGKFGAHMTVSSEGSGPVTILLDSKKRF